MDEQTRRAEQQTGTGMMKSTQKTFRKAERQVKAKKLDMQE
jgi:hypothetical protein